MECSVYGNSRWPILSESIYFEAVNYIKALTFLLLWKVIIPILDAYHVDTKQ